MRNGFKRIYLAMINEKEFHKLKIPKNGEVVSPRLFILFMESEKAIANAILCTYQDKSFPYEYIPSVFYNYDQGNVPFEYEDPLHEGTKSIALVKHLTLSVLYSQSFEYETLIRNCFINVTDCHVGLFNKLSRKSWEMMKSVLISNFGNSQQHILLMAVNWTILAHVPGMNSLKEKVNECCTDYIPHSEIEAYCSEHDISTFVDFKPQIEQDLVDIVEIIVKLLLLRVQHYNLFGKENLHRFSIFHVNKTRK
ncbi:hypothetical protein C9374_004600 [Naegleria lovaniensis]|uniref:Uncharacterized protein n=1 Tax=Naegleria lovaniensis TaxID=51637 RepID=A0AA88GSC9_NAELO|nr:uncharacterized protein C9374_004600 [Naegleria lovaniensis]KAG2383263.1 hypothetical protein C9374_004600 [Naegleria lovaniensis]